MSHRHLALAALVAALGLTASVPSASAAWVDYFYRSSHPRIALNPQPLPPGFRFAARLHCYGVQHGDPRKQPPVRVCN
jgi:hypothetical protein